MAVKKTSVVIVGAGGMSRWHVGCMYKMGGAVRVAGFVEPSEKSREAMAGHVKGDCGQAKVPPFYNTLEEFLAAQGPADCALIASPHNQHLAQAVACMEAGMDVLVEKPMVLNAAEARRAMKARDATGRLLSIAFNGSYSPALQKAKEMIAAGAIGKVVSINVMAVQDWVEPTAGTWRQVEKISGGGFLIDSGSHAVNSMIELAGADVRELRALQDNRGAPVELTSAIAGRFANNVYFTLFTEGVARTNLNRITVVGMDGLLHTNIYGAFLRVQMAGSWEEKPVELPESQGVFAQFLRVRGGEIPNPSPAEVGLRFAKFMDMVRKAVGKS
ncbi:MAG: Gfo/Idh/MocA family oxidoreductase [Kiritimatiellaeota bacterium]|nr:Gfo/Idh/MocA family oxidoreductase [Kiritimatiellota bacterium]